MMKARCSVLAAAALALVSGCSWEGSGSGDFVAWNDSFNFVNFSGVYRSPDGGVLVNGFGTVPGTAPEEKSFSQIVGSGVAGVHAYSGVLAKVPVTPGSLTIDCGAFHFGDNGATVLVGSIAGTSGSINYTTGNWTVNLGALEFPVGVEISANFRYTEGGTTGSVEPGSTGKPIFSLSVAQTGNILRFTDNNGAVYEGQISGISAPTGGGATAAGEGGHIDPQGASPAVTTPSTQTGTAIGQFEVQGQSSSGTHVKITGTLSLDFTTSTRTITTPGVRGNTTDSTSVQSNNRMLKATWIEDGGQTGDIVGSAG